MFLNFFIYLSLILITAVLAMDICRLDILQTRIRRYYLRVFKVLAIASIISTIITGIIGISQSSYPTTSIVLTNAAR